MFYLKPILEFLNHGSIQGADLAKNALRDL